MVSTDVGQHAQHLPNDNARNRAEG
ncbi:hypothetical protein PC111_g24245, partial [Phytophthora cactorum]